LGVAALLLFLLSFAILSGAATALAGTLAVSVFGGVLLGAVALMLPLPWVVVALVILSFVVTGQLIYFAGIAKALWFPYLLGALLLVRLPLDIIRRNHLSEYERKFAPKTPTGLTVFISLYLATVVASTLINTSPPLQVFVSSKEYLFLWGLYLVCAAGLIRPELVARIWAWLPWLMVLQLPLIFYQRFVVMPRRIGTGSPFDAVVGAFGGNPFGGGASGAMGMFCVIGIVIALARWRTNLISGWQTVLIICAGLLSIGLAEIKFMVLLLPVAFGLLFARELARKPIRGVIMISAGIVLAFGILFAYKTQYGLHTREGQTTQEYFERMFTKNTDSNYINMNTRQIGRVASVVLWYHEHDLRDPARFLLGHGAGASREGELVVGVAQQRYAFQLTRSSIGILLWETGILGALAYIAMLGATYIVLFRQAGEIWRPAESRATVASMAVAIAVFALSIPYDPSIMMAHQLGVMLMLCLGYASMMNGRGTTADVPLGVARQGSKRAVGQKRMRT